MAVQKRDIGCIWCWKKIHTNGVGIRQHENHCQAHYDELWAARFRDWEAALELYEIDQRMENM